MAARHGFEPCDKTWEVLDNELRIHMRRIGRAHWDAHARAARTAIAVLLFCAKHAGLNGGAQRPDRSRHLDRNAVLGSAGSQAGGFPSPRGGGRGEGAMARDTCGRCTDKAGGFASAESVDGRAPLAHAQFSDV